MSLPATAERCLTQGMPACVIEVGTIRGSTPRNTGARMLVTAQHSWGTIGGGHLEWQATALARQVMRETVQASPWSKAFPLGPSLGQCCGGSVVLNFMPLTAEVLSAWPAPIPRFHLELHGAGHVGRALVNVLRDIDCTVRWIDQRMDETSDTAEDGRSESWPPHIQTLATEDAVGEVIDAPANALHLVMTHRHDLDLALVHAILSRPDVQQGQAWVGMIGSQTKRASFEHRLQRLGHCPGSVARLCCPVGLPGLSGKEPAVIAVSVAAQLLLLRP